MQVAAQVVYSAGAGSGREPRRGSEDLPALPPLWWDSYRSSSCPTLVPEGSALQPTPGILQSCAPTRVVSQRDSKEHIHFLSFGQTSFARCEGRG